MQSCTSLPTKSLHVSPQVRSQYLANFFCSKTAPKTCQQGEEVNNFRPKRTREDCREQLFGSESFLGCAKCALQHKYRGKTDLPFFWSMANISQKIAGNCLADKRFDYLALCQDKPFFLEIVRKRSKKWLKFGKTLVRTIANFPWRWQSRSQSLSFAALQTWLPGCSICSGGFWKLANCPRAMTRLKHKALELWLRF